MAELDYEGFWKETLIQLRNDLGEAEFSGWFSETKYIRAQSSKTGDIIVINVVIGIPSAFHRDKVKSRYQNILITKLKELSGKEVAIEYEITGKTAKKEAASPENHQIEQKVDTLTDKEADSGAVLKPAKKRGKHPLLQENFTFEGFVIGDNNAFAANAAVAISKNPGKTYNPFLIYGGVGLGKTHLMQAIGNSIHENSDNKVIYTTSENFLNEYVQAVMDNKMSAFKNKFRDTDVLLIDDIQFFQSKERVQEELFHTFNHLLSSKKHLIFTCDRPPSEMKKLDERLRSRFEQCLQVDLQPPRYEERCAILRATAESRKAEIPGEVIDLIAKNISSNVRDLIGALNTLIAYTEIMKKPLTIEIAQQKLKNIFYAPKQANLTNDVIIRVVADYFGGLTPNDLKGKKRTGNIVFARQLAMYIAREMTDYSTTEIGQDFGGKDHTTVMHSIEKIRGKLLTDPTLESTIDSIKMQIKDFSAKH
ncbi:MAG: chromosomal replication initiator protein DnaA [Treponema sp.]|jgi:chromosomal replication initiator protein|nr:chromosomal replication initiator protein DnaA [Treponema sp.]